MTFGNLCIFVFFGNFLDDLCFLDSRGMPLDRFLRDFCFPGFRGRTFGNFFVPKRYPKSPSVHY